MYIYICICRYITEGDTHTYIYICIYTYIHMYTAGVLVGDSYQDVRSRNSALPGKRQCWPMQGPPGPRSRSEASSGPAIWAVKKDLKGSLKGDIDTNVDVDIDRYLGCLTGVSKSVQVQLSGIAAVMVPGCSVA